MKDIRIQSVNMTGKMENVREVTTENGTKGILDEPVVFPRHKILALSLSLSRFSPKFMPNLSTHHHGYSSQRKCDKVDTVPDLPHSSPCLKLCSSDMLLVLFFFFFF